MTKIKQIFNTEFQHHHAFILIVLAIFIFFSGNVFAYRLVMSGVDQQRVHSAQAVVTRHESSSASSDQGSLASAAVVVRQFVDNSPVSVGVWLQDLETGDYVGENGSLIFQSASMYKLFVAYEVYRRIDLGINTPDEQITTESGQNTIAKCLELAISYSDNACGRALRDLVDANIEPLPSLAEAGFVSTSLVNSYPTTSAKDVALMFEKLYTNTDLSQSSTQQFLNNLSAQKVNNRIPAGLPSGLQIAHKTGDLEGYSHDGGIIYTPKGNYILVIMSGPWQNGYDDVTSAISEFVSQLYAQL